MQPKVCSNLAKEYNGERNWCVLKDMHCPLLVKHERYSFDKDDIKCDYLNKLNGIDSKYGVVKEVNQSTKKCNGCHKLFKTSNSRVRYCSDICRKSARRKSERNSRAKA